MAKKIPNVDLLTETFDTWLNRTNSVIDILGTEVLTANTSLGVTGTPAVPLNSRLFGTFTANNLVAATSLSVPGGFSATPTAVTISAPISINGSVGTAGQILSSTGTSLAWTTLRIDTGASSGLIGGPITSSGELSVKAGPGIKVDSTGVNVDISYIQNQLSGGGGGAGFTSWETPGTIGSTTPNTGDFTTLTATNYRLTGVTADNFSISSSAIKISGNVDATTPGNGTTDTSGGVRIRSRGGTANRAVLQFTNQAATAEFGNLSAGTDGILRWPGSLALSSGNVSGGGLILSDDGDFVDLNDGYGSLRFTSGVAIYSGNRGGTSAIRLRSNGNIETTGQMSSGSVSTGNISSSGSIAASGSIQGADFVIPSDERLKDVVGNIENALSIVNCLDGVKYKWNEQGQSDLGYSGDKVEVGVLAQQLEKYLPELIVPSDSGDYKTVAYPRLVALLIEAIKELSKKVDSLENR